MEKQKEAYKPLENEKRDPDSSSGSTVDSSEPIAGTTHSTSLTSTASAYSSVNTTSIDSPEVSIPRAFRHLPPPDFDHPPPLDDLIARNNQWVCEACLAAFHTLRSATLRGQLWSRAEQHVIAAPNPGQWQGQRYLYRCSHPFFTLADCVWAIENETAEMISSNRELSGASTAPPMEQSCTSGAAASTSTALQSTSTSTALPSPSTSTALPSPSTSTALPSTSSSATTAVSDEEKMMMMMMNKREKHRRFSNPDAGASQLVVSSQPVEPGSVTPTTGHTLAPLSDDDANGHAADNDDYDNDDNEDDNGGDRKETEKRKKLIKMKRKSK